MPDNAAVALRLARGFAPHEAGVGHGAYEAKLVVLFFLLEHKLRRQYVSPGRYSGDECRVSVRDCAVDYIG